MNNEVNVFSDIFNVYRGIEAQIEMILDAVMYPLSRKPWSTQYVIDLEEGIIRHYDYEEKVLAQYIGQNVNDLKCLHKDIEWRLHDVRLLAIEQGSNYGHYAYIPGEDLVISLTQVCDMIKESISREHAQFFKKQDSHKGSKLIYA